MGKRDREEKEANKMCVIKLLITMGNGVAPGGYEKDKPQCSHTSRVREVGYLYAHSHQSLFGLLPLGVNFPHFLSAT